MAVALCRSSIARQSHILVVIDMLWKSGTWLDMFNMAIALFQLALAVAAKSALFVLQACRRLSMALRSYEISPFLACRLLLETERSWFFGNSPHCDLSVLSWLARISAMRKSGSFWPSTSSNSCRKETASSESAPPLPTKSRYFWSFATDSTVCGLEYTPKISSKTHELSAPKEPSVGIIEEPSASISRIFSLRTVVSTCGLCVVTMNWIEGNAFCNESRITCCHSG